MSTALSPESHRLICECAVFLVNTGQVREQDTYLVDRGHPFRYSLKPREEMMARFNSKKQRSVQFERGVKYSTVSFQQYKAHNEDACFVHHFQHGTLLGVFDGW